jgi:predicted RNase H-like HicB family nuclease
MEKGLSCNVSIHEEELNGKKVFVAECVDLGISDFGENLNEALSNLKKGINLLLEESPEKKESLFNPEPLMITRVFL